MTTLVADHPVQQTRATHDRVPMSRLVGVELRKMFDTRSGFWLMASIVIAAVVATGAVILFAPDDELTYDTFSAAIGFPMTVILPMVAILSVTGEWSQRSGLTTFTLVPHRGRVISAKALSTVLVGVVSIPLALAIGVVGNLVGTALAGTDLVWNMSLDHAAYIVLGNVLGMLIGFMLGVLVRSSAAAIVGYFVFAFVLPTVFEILAASQAWFRDLRPWVDFNYAQGALFNGDMTGEHWANLGSAGALWLLLPLTVGLLLVRRSEVK